MAAGFTLIINEANELVYTDASYQATVSFNANAERIRANRALQQFNAAIIGPLLDFLHERDNHSLCYRIGEKLCGHLENAAAEEDKARFRTEKERFNTQYVWRKDEELGGIDPATRRREAARQAAANPVQNGAGAMPQPPHQPPVVAPVMAALGAIGESKLPSRAYGA